MNKFSKHVWVLIPLFSVIYFFKDFFIHGQLPIPSDALVGLYHPFRDLFSNDYPNGIPFKNFLITDPVRQIIPWKFITIESFKSLQIPLWNPYEMGGKPLLGNFQSGSFYPLNLILFIKPFYFSWSLFILLQQLLGAIFMYIYLKSLNVRLFSAAFGSLAFIFSGFFISWLEWGTIVHTILWLPLMLFSFDQIISLVLLKNQREKVISSKKLFIWKSLFVSSIICAFFAGHMQTFFYIFSLLVFYMLVKIIRLKLYRDSAFHFLPLLFIIGLFTSVQWYPSIQFILISARSVDIQWQNEGWFIPLGQLAMFLSPDFFGNPATLNYWGEWNYGEFIGYIGVAPLLFAFFSLLRKDKKTYFFFVVAFLSIFFVVKNPISQLPFIFSIPFFSTAQPTRLLSLVVFSLAVLAALGMDYFYGSLKKSKKTFQSKYLLLFIIGIAFLLLWIISYSSPQFFNGHQNEAINVARRNLILPTSIFILSTVLISGAILFKKFAKVFIFFLIMLTAFDLTRFGMKFTPFTPMQYFYPETKAMDFLKKDHSVFRIANLDDRVIPPNITTFYKLQSIDGYDPLYTKNFGEIIASLERGKPDVSAPYGFNRIISPNNFGSQIYDLLNIKYILSLNDITSSKLELVFSEGSTKVYRNTDVFERAFFVSNIKVVKNDQRAIGEMYSSNLKNTAIILEENEKSNTIEKFDLSIGEVKLVEYNPSMIVIDTRNKSDGFLVLTDAFYPTWSVYIDGIQSHIYRTNYAFRGVFVPEGEHKIIFKNLLFK